MADNRKMLVYGYFGLQNNQLDGQTIKTRSIYRLLQANASAFGFSVDRYDTQSFKISRINLIKSWLRILKCDILFYIPAHSNLKYLFPFIYLICKIKNIDIHYVVVGGWLNDFLRKLPIHVFLLKRIKRIYPQTEDLCKNLRVNYSFDNVVQLHNFRFANSEVIKNENSKGIIRLVFMARVHPKKGVHTLFKLANRLAELDYKDILIDVYGPIQTEFGEEFNRLLKYSAQNIRYCGVIDPNQIVAVLRNYDLFLFPTEYYTEGFPGSILDAYLANIPVVVSRWKYAEEFVENNKSGVISAFENADDFINKVVELINNPEIIHCLKEGVADVKMRYTPEQAWEIIKGNI